MKSSIPVAKEFEKRGEQIEFYFLHKESEESILHMKEIGFDWDAAHIKYEDIKHIECDVAHLVLPGPVTRKVTRALYEKTDRPLIVSGLVGLLSIGISDCYYSRQGCDLIYVGSSENKRLLGEFAQKMGHNPERIVNTGLPIFDKLTEIKKKPHQRKKIVFAGQPTFPSSLAQRIYIVKKLKEMARARPEWDIVLKPRHRLEQTTYHKVEFHYELIVKAQEKIDPNPSNFSIDYTPLTKLFETTDMLITVSSTAGLESAVGGIETVFLADFGVTEAYGNQILMDSGCFMLFDEVSMGESPILSSGWLQKNITFGSGNVVSVVDMVLSKADYRAFEVNPVERWGEFERYLEGERVREYVYNPGLKSVAFQCVRRILKFVRNFKCFDRALRYVAKAAK